MGEAIASLGEIKATEALPELLKIYDTDPGRHRIRLVRAEKALGDDRPLRQEVERLSKRALNSEEPRDRGNAIRTLSWLAPREAQAVFTKATEDDNRGVRHQAERALARARRRKR